MSQKPDGGPAWQPIETAPVGVPVRLGWWTVGYGGETWREDSGIAWKATWWGGRRRAEWRNDATHWMPLPPPPARAQTEGEANG